MTFFPRVFSSALKYLPSDVNMTTTQKEEFLSVAVALSMRIGKMLGEAMPDVLGNQTTPVLQDITLNTNISDTNQQFVVLGLWQLLTDINVKAAKKAEDTLRHSAKVSFWKDHANSVES